MDLLKALAARVTLSAKSPLKSSYFCVFTSIDIVPIGLFKPSVYGDLNQTLVASCIGPTSQPTSSRFLPLPSYLGFGCIFAPKPDSCRIVTDNKVGSIFSCAARSKIKIAIGSGMEPAQPVGPCGGFCGTFLPLVQLPSFWSCF